MIQTKLACATRSILSAVISASMAVIKAARELHAASLDRCEARAAAEVEAKEAAFQKALNRVAIAKQLLEREREAASVIIDQQIEAQGNASSVAAEVAQEKAEIGL